MIKMKNRKAMSIPIVLLVFATIVLCVFTLFSFHLRNRDAREIVSYATYLEDIYAQEEIINFYIDNMIKQTDFENKAEFISGFKEELSRYKDANGNYAVSELSQIEEQVKDENIKIGNEKLQVRFTIKIERDTDKLNIDYVFEKSFEKGLS